MLDLSKVESISQMGGVKTAILQMLYDYSVLLTLHSPVTVQWIPLSGPVCAYELTTIPTSHLYGGLTSLLEDGYLDTKRFDVTDPACRCRLYKLTDKFYELLKE